MSTLTETPRPSLLSDKSLGVVQATAPVVAAHADEITAHFYPRMFAAHPELLRVFNQGNQATGEQSKALAGSVVAYAVQLIDPEAPPFDHVMRRIAYKHVSLGIRPEQYTIVGEHLLASVGEVLGDAVTPEIAAAWSEVYWLFALQLVAEEARQYQQASVDPSQPTRPYRVVRRIEETADVISLVLEPADGGPLPAIAPGQYVSVFVDLPEGDRQPRQYTVSSTAVRTRLQITVRRVRGANGAPDGRVSSYLHDQVKIGDVLDVSAPAGDFVLTPTESPCCISGEKSTTSAPTPGTKASMTTTPARAKASWTWPIFPSRTTSRSSRVARCRSCGTYGRRYWRAACRRPESAMRSSDPICGPPSPLLIRTTGSKCGRRARPLRSGQIRPRASPIQYHSVPRPWRSSLRHRSQ